MIFKNYKILAFTDSKLSRGYIFGKLLAIPIKMNFHYINEKKIISKNL